MCLYICATERNRGVEWLNCKPPFSEFLLDLLELILRERAAAFHNMPRFTVALRNEVRNISSSLSPTLAQHTLVRTQTG